MMTLGPVKAGSTKSCLCFVASFVAPPVGLYSPAERVVMIVMIGILEGFWSDFAVGSWPRALRKARLFLRKTSNASMSLRSTSFASA